MPVVAFVEATAPVSAAELSRRKATRVGDFESNAPALDKSSDSEEDKSWRVTLFSQAAITHRRPSTPLTRCMGGMEEASCAPCCSHRCSAICQKQVSKSRKARSFI